MTGGQGRPVKGLGIRLVDAPVSRRKDPRARTGVVDHLHPGASISRRFEVSNTTDRPLRVELYAAAASIDKQTFTYAPDRTANELTTWTTIEPAEVTLPPDSRRTARLTIQVPRTAWRGERYAMVWAQAGARPDSHHNLGLFSRVGIRMYLDIGRGGEPRSDMRIDTLTPERTADGRPRLLARVRNTGGRALDITGQLSLSDGPEGIRAGPYPVTSGVTLRPGHSGQVVAVLGSRLPNGPWKATLTLYSGTVKRTATATLTFPDSGVGRPVALSASSLIFPAALATLALAVATAVFVLLRRRRRRTRRSAQA